MIDERFLARLSLAFPSFYERVDAEAAAAARSLLDESHGDVQRALVRARFEGAGRLWWPYVKGSVPVLGDDRAAMEQFTRIVLTIDHLVGHKPGSLERAREQVTDVLRASLDVERLGRLAGRGRTGKAAAGTAGVFAGLAAVYAPIKAVRRVAGAVRWLPAPAKATLAGLALATAASIPIMAGYSAGRHAERAARGHEDVTTIRAPDGSVSYHSVPL
ncbi:MAG: hypothetical protein QOE90_3547 [Thermoplasmata archaeon]|jgi:hypothetical protein|nr:hypothetical protein [Thermoplasmata archaeon]